MASNLSLVVSSPFRALGIVIPGNGCGWRKPSLAGNFLFLNHKFMIAIRWILTILLLYTVWTNTHWSVALVLTLMALGFEIRAFAENIAKQNDPEYLTSKAAQSIVDARNEELLPPSIIATRIVPAYQTIKKLFDEKENQETVVSKWEERYQKKYKEYRERFSDMSNRQLIDVFNYDVGNPGSVRTRLIFLRALQDEFDNRNFDYSDIGDQTSFSLKNKVKIFNKKIYVDVEIEQSPLSLPDLKTTGFFKVPLPERLFGFTVLRSPSATSIDDLYGKDSNVEGWDGKSWVKPPSPFIVSDFEPFDGPSLEPISKEEALKLIGNKTNK